MQQYDSREEREIDLIDLMWRLLMQWKTIILVMLLCGILVAGLMYVKALRGYNAAEEVKEEIPDEELYAELTEAEYEDVIAAYNSGVQLDSLRTYLNESLYIQADPYDMRTLTISYRVDTEEETAYSVTSMYGTLLGSDAFIKEIAKAISYDGDIKYVRELVSVSLPGIESKSLLFSVNMTLLSDMDAAAIASVIDQYVTQTAYEDISAVSPYTVTKVGEIIRDIMNTGAATARMDYDTKIKNLKAAVTAATGAFSEEQKALYDKLTAPEKEAKENTVFKPVEEEADAPSLSLKYLLLGLFVGAFLYGGCVMLYAIFRPTIQTTTELSDVYRLYPIDEQHNRSFGGGMKGFINDKHIYRLRYRKFLTKANAGVEEAAVQIKGLCARDALEKVYLTPLGKSFESGKAAEYYAALKKRLTDAGVPFEELKESSLKDDILSVPKTAGIVILANVGDTPYRSLDAACGYARKYEIALLGVVALDM